MNLALKTILCIITFFVITLYFQGYISHQNRGRTRKNYALKENVRNRHRETKKEKEYKTRIRENHTKLNERKRFTTKHQSTAATENEENSSNQKTEAPVAVPRGVTLPNFDLKYRDFIPLTTDSFPTNLNFLSLPANLYSDLLRNRLTHFFLPNYNLHVCRINKNAATIIHAVLCFISDPVTYSTFFMQGNWKDGLSGSKCRKNTQTITKFASQPNFFERGDIRHLAIVRDPIERFVSAWQYICIHRAQTKIKANQKAGRVVKPYCFNCQDDIHCFITKNYAYLKAKSQGPNFKMERIQGGYFHFYPQTWYCDFDHNLNNYNYILNYNSSRNAFANELDGFLEKLQVPMEIRERVSTVMIQKSTRHVSDKGRTKDLLNEIALNKTMFDILYKTYYSDFQVLKRLKVLKRD